MIPFGKILKQSYWITKTNRFLWIFGLFLFWGNITVLANYSFDQNTSDYQRYDAAINTWISAKPMWAAVIGLAAVAVTAAIVYLYFRSRAGLILSVKNILDKKEARFKKGFTESRIYIKRIFKISLIINIFLVMLMALLAAPVIYLFASGFPLRALILGILGSAVFVPIYVTAVFLTSLAPCFVVSFNMKTKPAVLSSLDMIRDHWPSLLIFNLIMFGITIAATIAAIAGFMISTLPFVLLTRFVYHTGGFPAAFITGFGIGIGTTVFLFFQAVLAAYVHTAWVLVFEELVKPTSAVPETEPQIVPETIS